MVSQLAGSGPCGVDSVEQLGQLCRNGDVRIVARRELVNVPAGRLCVVEVGPKRFTLRAQNVVPRQRKWPCCEPERLFECLDRLVYPPRRNPR